MFDFIKKKLKDSINTIQRKLVKEEKEEGQTQEIPSVPPVEEPKTTHEKHAETIQSKKGVISEEPANKGLDEPIDVKKKEKTAENSTAREEIREEKKKAQSKLDKKKIFSHRITSEDISSIYGDIKEALLENNVAMDVVLAIHEDLERSLVGKEVSFLSNKKEVERAIKKSISDVMLEYPTEEFLSKIKNKKPYIILFMGVNGAGKTTTIAKMISFFKDRGFRVVVSASDTFRAASIEQIEIHTKKLGVNLIKHSYGADPAAVAFDAIKHAHSENADIVMIDTAGRSDINKNLIEELKKVKRVSKPDITIFVGDALTGNDAVNQARIFDREIGIDAIILSKADVDKKGGAILSISYVTKKPILFLGTGQGYSDLVPFNKEKTADFILS